LYRHFQNGINHLFKIINVLKILFQESVFDGALFNIISIYLTSDRYLMRLVSINTSRPKPIIYNGKEVLSGIFKQAVKGSVFVSKKNLEGDGQADLLNHGGEHKAVYGFSHNHYAYWREVLESPDLAIGVFGENLTITNLDEEQLYIGDQLRIGDLILEVSQPRVPCYKLGVSLKNKQAPQMFTNHFETGVYFRVKQEGSICTNDTVEVIKRSAHAISVKSLFRAYFDKSMVNSAEVLAAGLDVPELAPEWQEKIKKRLQIK